MTPLEEEETLVVFSSTIFLFAFLPLTLAGYYLLNPKFKNYFLLAASLFFYAWGEPKFVYVMISSILVNYLFALLIDHRKKRGKQKKNRLIAKAYLVAMVVFNLSLFFVYKYLDFAVTNINALGALFGMRSLPLRHIALPIGISFFTFQAMSYVFDVYYGRGEVQKNPLNVMLYVSLFPQLIAGPIVRYGTVAREINERKETLEDFAEGIRRFILGLGKKVLLANNLALLAETAFVRTKISDLSMLLAWTGALAFSLQIYFDFSGYSDMAVGLGRMFGFHFEENFNYPYISGSVTEFWRRWHISLGSWFRDYVYIPLGGSRVSKKRLVLNLLIVWLLTGIWHGASWNFVAWGLMYFFLLTFEKLTGWPQKLSHRSARVIYRIWTLLMVMLGWVLFNAQGIKNGIRYLSCMFGLTGGTFAERSTVFLLQQNMALLVVSMVLCMPVLPMLRRRLALLLGKYDVALYCVSTVASLALFLTAIALTVTGAYNPFIYFHF